MSMEESYPLEKGDFGDSHLACTHIQVTRLRYTHRAKSPNEDVVVHQERMPASAKLYHEQPSFLTAKTLIQFVALLKILECQTRDIS